MMCNRVPLSVSPIKVNRVPLSVSPIKVNRVPLSVSPIKVNSKSYSYFFSKKYQNIVY